MTSNFYLEYFKLLTVVLSGLDGDLSFKIFKLNLRSSLTEIDVHYSMSFLCTAKDRNICLENTCMENYFEMIFFLSFNRKFLHAKMMYFRMCFKKKKKSR